MAIKPSSVPEWNSGGANNTEPNAGKKILGWEPAEPAASSYFNWLFKLIWEWIKYLRDGVFTGGLDVTGAGDGTGVKGTGGAVGVTGGLGVEGVGTYDNAGVKGTGGPGSLAPGVVGVGGSTNGIGVKGTGVGTGQGGLFFGGASAVGVRGEGAVGGGDFSATGAGVPGVYALAASGPGVRAMRSDSTVSPAIDCRGAIDLDSSTAPGATTAVKNRQTRHNLIKAWALITTNGSGGITLVDGFNVSSVAISGGATVQITMAQAFANSNYIGLSMSGSTGVVYSGLPASSSRFDLVGRDTVTATNVDFSATTRTVMVAFLGAQ